MLVSNLTRAISALTTAVLLVALIPQPALAAATVSTFYVRNVGTGCPGACSKGSGSPTLSTTAAENGDTIRAMAIFTNGTDTTPDITLAIPAGLAYTDDSLAVSTNFGVSWSTVDDTNVLTTGITIDAASTTPDIASITADTGTAFVKFEMTVTSATVATHQPTFTLVSGTTASKFATVKVPQARITSATDSTTDTVVLTFGEAMKQDATIAATGTYALDSDGDGFDDGNPTGVTIDSTTQVTLTFAGAAFDGGDSIEVQMTGLLTAQTSQVENAAASTYETAGYSVADATAPTIASAVYAPSTASYPYGTITVTWDEAIQSGNLDSTGELTKLAISGGGSFGAPSSAPYWMDTSTLIIPLGATKSVPSGSTLSIATSGGTIADLTGNFAVNGTNVVISEAPTVTTFTLGVAETNSTTIPVTAMIGSTTAPATISKYLITETSTTPLVGAFSALIAPASYTLGSTPVSGTTKTLYAWVLDSDGSISSSKTATFVYDSVAPTVTNASSDTANGSYNAGDIIDIDLTFSEAVTSTGSVTVTLETGTTDQTCTFTITSSTTGTCNYTVQAGDTSSDLTVSSVTGTVKDAAGNALVTPATPTTNLAANKALIVDTTAPAFSNVSPATSATINNVTSSVGYTLSEAISSGTITITRTSGTADGSSPHTCTLIGTALDTGVHAAIDLTNTTNGCSSAITLVTGAVYTFAFAGTDVAGNSATTVTRTSVTYDTTAPAFSAVTPAESGAVKNVTTSSGIGYTISKTLASGTITITHTSGTADAGSPHTCTLAGTALTAGTRTINLSDTTNGCSPAVTLVVGTVYTFAFAGTDVAGNSATVVTRTGVAYDTTAPIITITDNASGSSVTSDSIIATITDNFDLATLKWGYDADGVCSSTASDYTTAYTSGATITVTPTHADYVCFYAADEAGNITTQATAQLHVAAASSGGGSGGGGGGGGSSGPDLTTPYKLPIAESTTATTLYQPLDLSLTKGLLTRPVTLIDYYAPKLTITLAKGTKLTLGNGNDYTGIVKPPKNTNFSPAGNLIPLAGAQLGATPDAKVGSGVTLTIPLDATKVTDSTKTHLFVYDATSKSWVRATNEKLATDKASVSATVTTFAPYAVFVTDAMSISLSGQTGNGGGTGGQTNGPTVGGLSDVPASQWFGTYVERLVALGSVAGYPDGTFRPGNQLNRAELAKIAVLTFGLTVPTTVATKPFTDVPTDAWFAPYVVAAKEAGVIGGYSDGTFRPDVAINRAEALKILLGAAKFTPPAVGSSIFADVPADAWFASIVAFAAERGVVGGYTETIETGWSPTRLVIGNSGDEVTKLQEYLTQLGFYDGPITGYFGPKTQVSVINFQNAHSPLATTDGRGVIGWATAKKIRELAGIASGTTTRTVFRPSASITRAEMAKIVVLVKELKEKK